MRGTQGHDLAHRHRNVGIAAHRLVAPAAFVVLRVDDQVDGLGEFFADLGPVDHAVGFGQEERGEAVAVHRSVTARAGHVDEAALLRVGQDEIDAARNVLAVRAAAGRAAAPQKGHAGQAAHGHIAAVAAGSERAVVMLLLRDEGQTALDRPLGFGRDELDARAFRIVVFAPGAARQQSRRRGRYGQRSGQKSPPRRSWHAFSEFVTH